MPWPPKRGEDLPPKLLDEPALFVEAAHGYERALRRIALDTDGDGNPTPAARMAYNALLGFCV